MSIVLDHCNEKLQPYEYHLSVTVYSIFMAWMLGLIIPTVFLL